MGRRRRRKRNFLFLGARNAHVVLSFVALLLRINDHGSLDSICVQQICSSSSEKSLQKNLFGIIAKNRNNYMPLRPGGLIKARQR
jgi:hypothetical protein